MAYNPTTWADYRLLEVVTLGVALAKDFITQPAVIIYKNPQPRTKSEGTVFDRAKTMGIDSTYIPIVSSSVVQNGTAEVAQDLVIAQGDDSKRYVNDNVAVSPWSWTVVGYLAGLRNAEPQNFYMPTVQWQSRVLRQAYRRGDLVTFQDADYRLYHNCVIKSISTSRSPEEMSAVRVQLTIQQLDIQNNVAIATESTEFAREVVPDGGEAVNLGSSTMQEAV